MKKHNLKLLALFGAAVMAFSFASCSNDDDDYNTPAVETTCTVVFDANAEDDVTGSTASIVGKAGSTVTLSPNGFVREGYNFAAWATSADGAKMYFNGANITLLCDMTLYAVWEKVEVPKESFGVTFYSNGGSAVDMPFVVVQEGKTVAKPADPTLYGYTFAGWYNGDVSFNFATPITANTRLVAHWKPIVYTITYELNGGAWADGYTARMEYTILDTVFLPDADEAVRAGYGIKGWTLSENADEEMHVLEASTTGDKTLWAQWLPGAAIYTVRHHLQNLDDESAYTMQQEEQRSGISGSETEAQERNFAGFHLSEAGITQKAIEGDGSTVVDLYYNRNSYTVTFSDGANGEEIAVPEPQTVPYGGQASADFAPERKGYIFEGWFNGGIEYDFDTAVTSGITLTARWEAIFYTVSVTDGIAHGSITASLAETTTGTKVTLMDTPEDGYELDVWFVTDAEGGAVAVSDGSFSMPPSNVTVNATFKEKVIIKKPAPDTAGDIVLSDGTAIAYTEGLTLKAEIKAEVAGVAFPYNGKWLMVGLKQSENISLMASKAAYSSLDDYLFEGNRENDGFAMQKRLEPIYDFSAENYPSFYYAKTYTAPGYTSGWYLPSIEELKALDDVKRKIQDSLAVVGGTALDPTKYFWSSSCGQSDDGVISPGLTFGDDGYYKKLGNVARKNSVTLGSGLRTYTYYFYALCIRSVQLTVDSTLPKPTVKPKPAVAGDIVLSDGTAVTYYDYVLYPKESRPTAVGVAFQYNGTLLMVGLYESEFVRWCTWIDRIHLFKTSETDGSVNWSIVKQMAGVSNDDNYPAFKWANDYRAAGKYTSGWYLPAINELYTLVEDDYIIRGNRYFLNVGLAAAGGDQIDNSLQYWSSSMKQNTQPGWVLSTSYDEVWQGSYDAYFYSMWVRCIRRID